MVNAPSAASPGATDSAANRTENVSFPSILRYFFCQNLLFQSSHLRSPFCTILPARTLPIRRSFPIVLPFILPYFRISRKGLTNGFRLSIIVLNQSYKQGGVHMPWELDSDRPIYAQIVDRLKHEIVSGFYPPGSPASQCPRPRCTGKRQSEHHAESLHRAGAYRSDCHRVAPAGGRSPKILL